MPNDSTDSPSITTEILPSTATLGDLLHLDLRIAHPAAETVQPPAWPKTLGSFEVVTATQAPAQVNQLMITEHFTAELQNFSTGPQMLPPISITYKDVQQKTHTVLSPPARVTIQEVRPGPNDKGDIRGIVGVIGPVAWSPWWWLLVAAIILGAAAYAWAKRKKLIEGPPPPPPVPADQQALQRLRDLQATGWIEAGKLKEFYSGLSDIVRGYLEAGFGIVALERTTNELMRELRKRNTFDSAQQIELKDLLEGCDLVKFAKFRPSPEEALSEFHRALKFVEETRHALRQS